MQKWQKRFDQFLILRGKQRKNTRKNEPVPAVRPQGIRAGIIKYPELLRAPGVRGYFVVHGPPPQGFTWSTWGGWDPLLHLYSPSSTARLLYFGERQWFRIREQPRNSTVAPSKGSSLSSLPHHWTGHHSAHGDYCQVHVGYRQHFLICFIAVLYIKIGTFLHILLAPLDIFFKVRYAGLLIEKISRSPKEESWRRTVGGACHIHLSLRDSFLGDFR